MAERTKELQELNTKLKHANENLEQFALIAAFDLQAPLRKIERLTYLLQTNQQQRLTDEQASLVGNIMVAKDLMSTLLKAVLSFSRFLDSRGVFQTVDLNMILLAVIDDFAFITRERNVVMSHDPLPTIEGIPLQLTQLFYNVISNALKCTMSNSTAEINISAKILTTLEVSKFPVMDPNLTYHQITIKDNGTGFPDQLSEKIFRVFQRENSKNEFNHAGIGLALCKKIMVNHHGKIYAESKLGEGAEFHIVLPGRQAIPSSNLSMDRSETNA